MAQVGRVLSTHRGNHQPGGPGEPARDRPCPLLPPARSGPGAGPDRSLGGHRGEREAITRAPPAPPCEGARRVPRPVLPPRSPVCPPACPGQAFGSQAVAVSEAARGRPRSYPRRPGDPVLSQHRHPSGGSLGSLWKARPRLWGTSLPWALLPGTAWPRVCVTQQGDLPPLTEPPQAGRPGRSRGLQRTLWGSEQTRRPVTQLLLALCLSSHFCSLFPRAGPTHLNLQAYLPNQEVPQPFSHAGRGPPGPGQACSVGAGAASRVPGPHLPGVPAPVTPDQPTHQTLGAARPPAGGVDL